MTTNRSARPRSISSPLSASSVRLLARLEWVGVAATSDEPGSHRRDHLYHFPPDERTRRQAIEGRAICYLPKLYDDEELLRCIRLDLAKTDAYRDVPIARLSSQPTPVTMKTTMLSAN